MAFSFKSLIFPLTLLFLIAFTTSARILDEVNAPDHEADAPVADEAQGGGVSGSVGGAAGGVSVSGGGASGGVSGSGTGAAGGASGSEGGASGGASGSGAGAAGGASGSEGGAASGVLGSESGAATGGAGAGAATASSNGAGAGAVADGAHPELVFFMHDILGGTNPTAKAITGVVTNPAVSGQVPFAKPNGAILTNKNGISQNNDNAGILNNNNVPFLTGLGGVNPNVMQNNGNNYVGGNGFPVVNGAQLTSGTSLQQLMFGTMMAIDDELTEGHALNSGMIGRAQGFYVYSSVDGKTQTMAFTAMFQEGGYHNSLNFFGVHQTAVSESVIGIMGGTGKYVNAKGFAVVKTLPPVDQHESDGLQTVLEFSVFLTY